MAYVEPMYMKVRLREPKVGMKIVSKSNTCCFGMPKNDVGEITKVDPNGLEFDVRDWKGDTERHCVQCVWWLKPVTKEEWIAICDKEEKRNVRRV